MKAFILLCGSLLAVTAASQAYMPSGGFVPDEKTAIEVAEAVLKPVYGEEKIISERPFRAKLEKGIWTISGTLHCKDRNGNATVGCHGGVAIVRISRTDGRILSMIHGK